MTEDHVNHSQSGNVFMLGAGGVFVVMLSAYFGRLPILFYFTVTAFWTAIGCAEAKDFDTFMAFRILNGFFSTVAQAGGMMFIKDMFFVHERARKINIWASFVILSPVSAVGIRTMRADADQYLVLWPFGHSLYPHNPEMVSLICAKLANHHSRGIGNGHSGSTQS